MISMDRHYPRQAHSVGWMQAERQNIENIVPNSTFYACLVDVNQETLKPTTRVYPNPH
jgi:hypothetical protein